MKTSSDSWGRSVGAACPAGAALTDPKATPSNRVRSPTATANLPLDPTAISSLRIDIGLPLARDVAECLMVFLQLLRWAPTTSVLGSCNHIERFIVFHGRE